MACLVGGCLRRLVVLALFVAAAAVAVQYRAELADAWRGLRGSESDGITPPHPVLAESAEAKIASLAGDDSPGRVALSEAEIQSLLVYRLAGFMPSYVSEPRIELRGGRVRGQVKVPVDRIGPLPEASDLLGILPDTTLLALGGHLIPVDERRVGIAVDEISAARVPLPRRLIPVVLERLGRPEHPGLSADTWAVPLPPGATDAFVHGGMLVFLTRSGTRGDRGE